jgi:serine/threonine-protein kinase
VSYSTDFGTTNNLPVQVSVPGYRLRAQVGADALGYWFDAEQESLGRKLTVKILRPEYQEHPAARREFLAEMDRLANLDHPNLIHVLDTRREGVLALVTDRVVRNLATLLRPKKPLGEGPSLLFASGLVRALRYLQEQGLAHKNVTPRLITVREDGGCRLVTFRNVVTIQELADLKGKLIQDASYIAPEQLSGEDPVGPTTPCYQVGALLFHMLSGMPPHAGGTPQEVARAHLTEEFPSLKRFQPFLDAGIYRIIDSCTRRAPAERATLEQIANAFDSLAQGKDFDKDGKPKEKVVTPRSKRRRRRR